MEKQQFLPPGQYEVLPPAIHPSREALSATGPYGDGPYPGFDANDEPETGGLIEYWRILRRRKGTLMLIAFAGSLIDFCLRCPKPPSTKRAPPSKSWA